jgi:catechol 2,3-dioxygenase-like lactoylglutathione lyase family enzyme
VSVKVHHAALAVEDLEGAARQWAQMTGFAPDPPRAFTPEQAAAAGLGRVSMTAQHLTSRTGVLELVHVQGEDAAREQPAATVAEPGITHACLQAPGSEGRFDQLVAAGARPQSPPVLLGTGIRYAYVRDEAGNVLELEQLYAQHLSDAPAGAATWLGHVGLCTADIDRATQFWVGVLETEPYARAEFGPMPAFDEITGLPDVRMSWSSWLRTGVLGVELWQFHEPATRPRPQPRGVDALGWHHVGLACTDVRAERERLVALGARFPEPPAGDEPVPVLFGRDPDGNLLELLDTTAPADRDTPGETA